MKNTTLRGRLTAVFLALTFTASCKAANTLPTVDSPAEAGTRFPGSELNESGATPAAPRPSDMPFELEALGSGGGALPQDSEGVYSIEDADGLSRFLDYFHAEAMLSDDQIQNLRQIAADDRALIGSLVHSGCFPATAVNLRTVDGITSLIAVKDPREDTVTCALAINTIAVVSVEPGDIEPGSLRLASDLPPAN